MSTVAIKNINEQLYRKAKALASLKGKTVGEVMNEALGLWVEVTSKNVSPEDWIELENETANDNQAFENIEAQLLVEHNGQYVAFADGKLIGTFKREKEACNAVRKISPRHGIVTLIEREEKKKHPKVVELGWSFMEKLA